MKVLYHGPVGSPSGYGVAATDYAMSILRQGIDLTIKPAIAQPQLDERYAELRPCIDKLATEREFDVVIIHAIPPVLTAVADQVDEIFPDARKIAVTTWETHRMPWEFSSDIDKRFDKIVVPSEFVKTAFYGYEKDVVVIPHCFDPEWWFASYSMPYGPYSFYTIGTELEQKNLRGLLIAYLSEFTSKDNVHLEIQSPTWDKNGFVDLVQKLGVTDPPSVHFFTDRCSDKDLRTLHQEADCYVTLAHGEGFGLGAFEASLVGNPVIATEFSGLLEHVIPGRFCKGELIPCQLTPAFVPAVAKKDAVYRMGPLGVRCDQLWAEPNLLAARHAMREMYNSRMYKNIMYRGNLLERFGYDAVGRQWREVLK
jgi:glycosyltransferase involved in cell wall biosynthesis